MPDFYSPQLTENADGTTTDWHSLGSSSKHGLSRDVHSINIPIPVGVDFAVGDKIVIAIVPANFKLVEFREAHSTWITGSTVKAGIYLVNHDGTVGAKASAGSDVIFNASIDLNASADAFVDLFSVNTLDIYDRGKQLWELVNEADAATYAESPGGDFALVFEVLGSPAVTIAVQNVLVELHFNSIN